MLRVGIWATSLVSSVAVFLVSKWAYANVKFRAPSMFEAFGTQLSLWSQNQFPEGVLVAPAGTRLACEIAAVAIAARAFAGGCFPGERPWWVLSALAWFVLFVPFFAMIFEWPTTVPVVSNPVVLSRLEMCGPCANGQPFDGQTGGYMTPICSFEDGILGPSSAIMTDGDTITILQPFEGQCRQTVLDSFEIQVPDSAIMEVFGRVFVVLVISLACEFIARCFTVLEIARQKRDHEDSSAAVLVVGP